jgi:hypothetical protein
MNPLLPSALLLSLNSDAGEAFDAVLAGLGCIGLITAFIISLAIFALIIYCYWRICCKAGYSGTLSLLLLLPGLGRIILLLILAFGDWPITNNKEKDSL